MDTTGGWEGVGWWIWIAPRQDTSWFPWMSWWKQVPLTPLISSSLVKRVCCINELLIVKNDTNFGWMLSVPTGYFIYDFFDMVMNQKLGQSWELLFHHVVVGLSIITVKFKNKMRAKMWYFGFILNANKQKVSVSVVEIIPVTITCMNLAWSSYCINKSCTKTPTHLSEGEMWERKKTPVFLV